MTWILDYGSWTSLLDGQISLTLYQECVGGDTHLAVAILAQYNWLPMQIICFPKKVGEVANGSHLKRASESLTLQQSVVWLCGEAWKMSVHPTGSTRDRQKKEFHPSVVQWANEYTGVLTGLLSWAWMIQKKLHRHKAHPSTGDDSPKLLPWELHAQLVGSSACRKVSFLNLLLLVWSWSRSWKFCFRDFLRLVSCAPFQSLKRKFQIEGMTYTTM